MMMNFRLCKFNDLYILIKNRKINFVNNNFEI